LIIQFQRDIGNQFAEAFSDEKNIVPGHKFIIDVTIDSRWLTEYKHPAVHVGIIMVPLEKTHHKANGFEWEDYDNKLAISVLIHKGYSVERLGRSMKDMKNIFKDFASGELKFKYNSLVMKTLTPQETP
jgi:hypothetical protein